MGFTFFLHKQRRDTSSHRAGLKFFASNNLLFKPHETEANQARACNAVAEPMFMVKFLEPAAPTEPGGRLSWEPGYPHV